MEHFFLLGKLYYTRISLTEKSFVERIAKTFCSLGNFLVNLLVELCHLVLDENIGAIALLRIAVVNQRVVESVNVARSFPDCWVHEYSRINTHNIFMKQRHGFPPIALNVILQFYTILSIIIYSRQPIINLTRWENKTVFLGV